MDKKYRVNELAKDLNIPVSEITDVVQEYFGVQKKSQASLSEDEMSVVLEKYSQSNQVKNFNSYFASASKPKTEKKEEKPAEKPAKKAEKKPESNKEADKAEKVQAKPETKTEAKPEAKPEIKTETNFIHKAVSNFFNDVFEAICKIFNNITNIIEVWFKCK